MVEFVMEDMVLREGGDFYFGCGGWFVFDGVECWVFDAKAGDLIKKIVIEEINKLLKRTYNYENKN